MCRIYFQLVFVLSQQPWQMESIPQHQIQLIEEQISEPIPQHQIQVLEEQILQTIPQHQTPMPVIQPYQMHQFDDIQMQVLPGTEGNFTVLDKSGNLINQSTMIDMPQTKHDTKIDATPSAEENWRIAATTVKGIKKATAAEKEKKNVLLPLEQKPVRRGRSKSIFQK